MHRYIAAVCLVILVGVTAGCNKEEVSVAVPGPSELRGEEIGYYCNMTVIEHAGPKGQVFLTDRERPLWFSSARDTVAFTMLPEEPRNISAIYVTDMGLGDWNRYVPGAWVQAGKAWYVVGSGKVGGMGAPEPVPFADRIKAEEFRHRHGGRVLAFNQIPAEEILGFDDPTLDHVGQVHVNRPE